MKKNFFMFLCIATLFTTGSFPSHAKQITNSIATPPIETKSLPTHNKTANAITPYSIDTEWRYMTVGNKTYRRLYDLRNNCWIGDWELVP